MGMREKARIKFKEPIKNISKNWIHRRALNLCSNLLTQTGCKVREFACESHYIHNTYLCVLRFRAKNLKCLHLTHALPHTHAPHPIICLPKKSSIPIYNLPNNNEKSTSMCAWVRERKNYHRRRSNSTSPAREICWRRFVEFFFLLLCVCVLDTTR